MKMKKAAFIGHSLLEKGEKKSKGCLTVAFFWPMIPVLMGKSIKSRCFKALKNLKKSHMVLHIISILMINEIMTALL